MPTADQTREFLAQGPERYPLSLLLLRVSMTEQLSGVVQVPRRCPVRSGAEIGLLSLRLSVSQGASLGDFLLAPARPIEKVTLWE